MAALDLPVVTTARRAEAAGAATAKHACEQHKCAQSKAHYLPKLARAPEVPVGSTIRCMRFAAAAALVRAPARPDAAEDDNGSSEPPSAPVRMTLVSAGDPQRRADPEGVHVRGAGHRRRRSPGDGTPGDARELAILVEDPDAPGGTFVHWVVFGIDPGHARCSTRARASQTPARAATAPARRATSGPCPPQGDKPHRYVFSHLRAARADRCSRGRAGRDDDRADPRKRDGDRASHRPVRSVDAPTDRPARPPQERT